MVDQLGGLLKGVIPSFLVGDPGGGVSLTIFNVVVYT